MRVVILLFCIACPVSSAFARELYIPHFASGAGVRSRITLTNFSGSICSFEVQFYDSDGNPLPVTVDNFEVPTATFSVGVLPLVASIHMISDEETLKTGYVRIVTDQDEVDAVGVFAFADGREAIIRATPVGMKFAILAETTNELDTAIGVSTTTNEPVVATLLSVQGKAIASRRIEMLGKHRGVFVSEVFEGHRGQATLLLESSQPFAVVGLRFGPLILSDVPIYDFR